MVDWLRLVFTRDRIAAAVVGLVVTVVGTAVGIALLNQWVADQTIRDWGIAALIPAALLGGAIVFHRVAGRAPAQGEAHAQSVRDSLLADAERSELESLRAMAAQQDRQQRYARLEQLQAQAQEFIDFYSADTIAAQPSSAKTDAIRALENLDVAVRSVLSGVPDHVAQYEAPDRVVWSALAWHEQIVGQFKIRHGRINNLKMRYV